MSKWVDPREFSSDAPLANGEEILRKSLNIQEKHHLAPVDPTLDGDVAKNSFNLGSNTPNANALLRVNQQHIENTIVVGQPKRKRHARRKEATVKDDPKPALTVKAPRKKSARAILLSDPKPRRGQKADLAQDLLLKLQREAPEGIVVTRNPDGSFTQKGIHKQAAGAARKRIKENQLDDNNNEADDSVRRTKARGKRATQDLDFI